MDKWISSFIIGAILSLFLPKVPVLFCLFLCGVCFLLSFQFKFFTCIYIVLLGHLWISANEIIYQKPLENISHSTFLKKEIIALEGIVTNIPKRTNKKQYFTFEVTKLNDKPVPHTFLARLSWKESSYRLYQGQQWKLYGRLKPAHGYGNVGGFNYRSWLRHHQILMTGYILNHSRNVKLPNSLIDEDTTLRQKLYNHAENILKDKPLKGVVKALSFGERGDITPAQRKILQVTATGHLIAISGLHLGLIATGSFLLVVMLLQVLPLNKLPLFLQRGLVGINSKYIAIALSLSITCFYAYISGFSLPTLRALLMIVIYWVLRFLGLKLTWRSTLLIVIFMVILLWPFSLISVSFWLSFYAVLIIFLLNWRFAMIESKDHKVVQWWKVFFRLQLALSIALLPLIFWINYECSVLSIIANLIAVPLMSFTAIPLCLLATLMLSVHSGFSTVLFESAYFFIDVLWGILQYLSEQTWAIIPLGIPSIMLFCLGIFYFILRLLWGTSWRRYDAVVPVVLLSLLLYRQHVVDDTWQVNVFDVGQGLSVAIEKNHNLWLYDTGASYPSGFNFVDAVVIPYTKSRGINAISRVVISHTDNDHAGGLSNLIDYSPKLVLRGNDPILQAHSFCQKGHRFNWQDLHFDILWPLSPVKGQENDDSCVVKVSDGRHTLLLTGDISSDVEQYLVASGTSLKADILIAPHHGSKSSSSEAFITEVSPQIVVFSTGYLNQWRMPNISVIKRYQTQGTIIFNTAEQGMVRFNMDKNEIHTQTYRHDLWPFWFAHD